MQPTIDSRAPRRELLVIIMITVTLVSGAFIARSSATTTRNGVMGVHNGSAIVTTPTVATGPEAPRDWPAMFVIYRTGDTIVRLEYQDAYQWRKEVIESPRDPEMVGKVMTVHDMTYTESIPNTVDRESREPATYTETLPSGKVAPERWLHPDYAQFLETKHFVASAGDVPNEIAYRQVWTVPCAPAPSATDSHPTIPQPAACDSGTTYEEVESYVFRTDVTPPIAVAGYTEVDGKMTWQFEVLEIDVTSSSSD